MRALIGTAAVAVLLAGCGGGGSTSPVSPISTTPTLAELRAAPTETTVSSDTLQASANLFLNMMPTVGTGTTGISGVLRVTSKDGSAVPTGVSVVSAYAVQNDQAAPFSTLNAVTATSTGGLVVNLVGGPAFAAGTRANIVVVLRDAMGTTYLLQTTNALIVGAS